MSDWAISERHRTLLRPATVIDVGVNRGTPALYGAFPDAYYLLVEPNKENRPHIEKILGELRGEHVMCAAGAENGILTLNVETSRTGLSSFLKRTELTATGNRIERREVPIRTLDDLTGERALDAPFGLKIDTEGFELQVIRGATRTLERCDFVITETSTAERFEHSYQPHELIGELGRHQFVVADIMKTTGRYADLLFLRRELAFGS
jgi:FkbM family methyltransferase